MHLLISFKYYTFMQSLIILISKKYTKIIATKNMILEQQVKNIGNALFNNRFFLRSFTRIRSFIEKAFIYAKYWVIQNDYLWLFKVVMKIIYLYLLMNLCCKTKMDCFHTQFRKIIITLCCHNAFLLNFFNHLQSTKTSWIINPSGYECLLL